MSEQGAGRYFCFIKNKVSSDWKDLAWCLGFETPDIDNIDGKHRDDKSRCMDLLQQWYKREGNAATIHVLMEALQVAELQHVVDNLKDKYHEHQLPVQDNKRKIPQGQEAGGPKKRFQTNSVLPQPTARVQAGNSDALKEEVKMLKEKNDKLEKIILEQNEKIQQLQETNKNMEARIEELLTVKQPAESLSQQKYPMSSKHSMDKSKGTKAQQVKQPKMKDIGINVRSIRVGQPWMRKVRFGGRGSGRGEFKWPYGVAVSQDNEVYIADKGNKRIQVFTMDGAYIREFTTTMPGETGEKLEPNDVAADRNDNLWVVGDDHVKQYSRPREGTCLGKMDFLPVDYLHSITVSMATKQVIVTEYDGKNGRLQVFKQDGSDVGMYGFYFQGICVDGMGNIIVADSGNGCVKMFDSQGRFLCHVGSGMEYPCNVAVSPGGDVVVTEYGNHTASVWTQGY
ncbi:RING finger protein nhl-1-like [Branchiostoma floridae]|uniref:RING finger protein nhl-1-like n=1 Tax=Branchiostoma floridae TaxID=7739 RepID=A0A9J7MFM5_BRAFL|nr:RING finger protein nhl-1-like [Branchiostoma floridae]